MKFLIWTCCIVPAAFFIVLLEHASGSSMGALPKTIIVGFAFASAFFFCKLLDEKRAEKKKEEKDEKDSTPFLDDQEPLNK